MNPFKEMEDRLKELQERLIHNDDLEAFTQDVNTLTLIFQGQSWRLGIAGKWEKQEGEKWVFAVPPDIVDIHSGTENNATLMAETPKAKDPIIPVQLHPKHKPSVTQNPANEDTEPHQEGFVADQKPTKSEINLYWKKPAIIFGGVILLLLLCGMLAFINRFLGQNEPTSTAIIQIEPMPAETLTEGENSISPTATVTNPLILVDSPTLTPTATQSPINTSTSPPSATAVPVDTPTITATPIPELPAPTDPIIDTPTITATPMPEPPTPTDPIDTPTVTYTSTPESPTPTHTPLLPPTITPTPTPSTIGILAYPLFDRERETYDVYIIDLSTKKEMRVVRNASQPDISPDGEKIVYRSWQSDARGLFVEDLLTGSNRWQASKLHEANRPIWDAIDNRLIYTANNVNPDQWDLLFELDTPQGSGGQTPAWFKDGRMVYQGSIGANSGLILTGLGGPVFLTQSFEDKAPSPAPDGSSVVFTSKRDNQWDLYLVNVSSRGIIRLTNDTALESSPIWSPDGQRIAFVSNREGVWAIWTITPTGEDAQILLNLPGSYDGKVKNVPDNSQTGWQLEHISWVN